jgi:hypothetical protein
VVAARVGKRHGAARIAAEAIGHQPLIAGGAFPIAADLTAERQIRDLFIENTVLKMPVEYRFDPTRVSDDA